MGKLTFTQACCTSLAILLTVTSAAYTEFSCGPDEILMYKDDSPDKIRMICGSAEMCDQQLECVYSEQSVCSGEYDFVAATVESKHFVKSTCCTIQPIPDQLQGFSCRTLSVIDPNASDSPDGSEHHGISEEPKEKPDSSEEGNGLASPGSKGKPKVGPVLETFPLEDPFPMPNNFVQKITKSRKRIDVTVCVPICRTTTTTTTTPTTTPITTPKPKSKSEEDESAPKEKGEQQPAKNPKAEDGAESAAASAGAAGAADDDAKPAQSNAAESHSSESDAPKPDGKSGSQAAKVTNDGAAEPAAVAVAASGAAAGSGVKPAQTGGTSGGSPPKEANVPQPHGDSGSPNVKTADEGGTKAEPESAPDNTDGKLGSQKAETGGQHNAVDGKQHQSPDHSDDGGKQASPKNDDQDGQQETQSSKGERAKAGKKTGKDGEEREDGHQQKADTKEDKESATSKDTSKPVSNEHESEKSNAKSAEKDKSANKGSKETEDKSQHDGSKEKSEKSKQSGDKSNASEQKEEPEETKDQEDEAKPKDTEEPPRKSARPVQQQQQQKNSEGRQKSGNQQKEAQPKQPDAPKHHPQKEQGNVEVEKDTGLSHHGDGGAGGGGGPACFAGDTLVDTPNGPVEIRDMMLQEKVLSMRLSYKIAEPIFSPVRYFIHSLPHASYEFVTLTTGRSNRTLSLTPDHLLPILPCAVARRILQQNAFDYSALFGQYTKLAGDVKLGDCVGILTSSSVNEPEAGLSWEPIADIKRETKRGIFAPVTANGILVTNGVLASCHSGGFGNHYIQQSMFEYLMSVADVVSATKEWLAGEAGLWTPQGIFGPVGIAATDDGNMPLMAKLLISAAKLLQLR